MRLISELQPSRQPKPAQWLKATKDLFRISTARGPSGKIGAQPFRLPSLLAAMALLTPFHAARAQTTILSPQPGGGALPTNWTGVNNVTTNPIDRGTYWHLEAATTGDLLITSNYNLATFSSITINVNVATFGTGTANALKIEYSTDGGTTWNPNVFTTATPSSSTYIAGGPVTISASFSSTTKLRFSPNGNEGRGVRIQQLGITGIVPGSDSTPPSIEARTPGIAATDVSINPSFSITFDENIVAGAGLVRLFKENGTSDIAVPISAVAINGKTASFSASAPLESNALHYILVDGTAFFDLAAPNPNAFPGIISPTAWTFTTEVIPDLTNSSPYTQEFTGFSFANPTLPDGWSLSGPVTGFNADETQRVWNEGFNSGLRGGADLLGFQHTGSTGTLVKTLNLRNGTGAPLTELTILYAGRAARLAELRKPSYTVQVNGTTVAGLGYSTASGDNVIRGAGVTVPSIAAGGLITITWSSDRDTVSTSGSSSQIGLDNVSVSVGLTAFAPSVGVTSVTYATLGTTTASVSSEVAADGGSAITARGFVYSPTATNSSPIIGNPSVSEVTVPPAAVGPMSTTLTALAPATSYSVRSYATNSEGTTYSAPVTLVTLGTPPLFTSEYTQGFVNFTGSIATGGFPDGWKLLSSTGANSYVGTWGPSSVSGGIVGGDSNPGVLGYQNTGSTGTATASLTLVNNTGGTLSQLNVAYLGRVERPTQTRFPVWTVTVAGTTIPELAYTTANGVDEMKSHFVTGLSIAAGAEFTITWATDGNVGTTGSSRQIGIAAVQVLLNAPLGGFAGWIDGFFPGDMDPNTIGFDADPDFDGVPNGVEALIGGNPDSSGVFDVTALTKDGNTFTFRYPQAKSVPVGVTASYEWSTDLANWQASGDSFGGVTVTLSDDLWDQGEEVDTYEVTATTTGAATKLFVRVLAEN